MSIISLNVIFIHNFIFFRENQINVKKSQIYCFWDRLKMRPKLRSETWDRLILCRSQVSDLRPKKLVWDNLTEASKNTIDSDQNAWSTASCTWQFRSPERRFLRYFQIFFYSREEGERVVSKKLWPQMTKFWIHLYAMRYIYISAYELNFRILSI